MRRERIERRGERREKWVSEHHLPSPVHGHQGRVISEWRVDARYYPYYCSIVLLPRYNHGITGCFVVMVGSTVAAIRYLPSGGGGVELTCEPPRNPDPRLAALESPHRIPIFGDYPEHARGVHCHTCSS